MISHDQLWSFSFAANFISSGAIWHFQAFAHSLPFSQDSVRNGIILMLVGQLGRNVGWPVHWLVAGGGFVRCGASQNHYMVSLLHQNNELLEFFKPFEGLRLQGILLSIVKSPAVVLREAARQRTCSEPERPTTNHQPPSDQGTAGRRKHPLMLVSGQLTFRE